MAWDEEKKQKAVELYQSKEPTAENSMEIVKEVADELEESPNGVRMILTKANVYVKKAAAAASSSGSKSGGSTGGTRVSKEGAQTALKEAIEKVGKSADDEIISKLTGKAAVYFTSVLEGLTAE